MITASTCKSKEQFQKILSAEADPDLELMWRWGGGGGGVGLPCQVFFLLFYFSFFLTQNGGWRGGGADHPGPSPRTATGQSSVDQLSAVGRLLNNSRLTVFVLFQANF